jgi:predicted Zn-dependent protease
VWNFLLLPLVANKQTPRKTNNTPAVARSGIVMLLILAGYTVFPARAPAAGMGSAEEVVHLPAATLSSLPSEIAFPPVLAPPAENESEQPNHSGPVRHKYDLSQIGTRSVGSGVNLYSLEREQAWGRELAQQVQMQARMVKDPVVNEYVNRVAQALVRNSDAKVPFTVHVIDDEEVDAFALPGGFFFVNSGLILAADNEAELAGVMAHEIAHVAARHATRNATRMQILDIASIPLIFVGGPAGYGVRQLLGLAVPMSFLKFSRDDERQADLLGLQYAYSAGYDPAEFVHFFETLRASQKKKHSPIAKAFSTHPMTDERIERAQKEIATVLPPKDEYIVDTSEFDDIKVRLAQLRTAHAIIGGKAEAPVLRRRSDDGKNPDGGGNGPVLRK